MDAAETWKAIGDAVNGKHAGKFVPVLGPAVAQTPVKASVQNTELRRVKYILTRILGSDDLRPIERHYVAWLAQHDNLSEAEGYLANRSNQKFASQHKFEDDTQRERFFNFQVSLVKLAAHLTQVWASALYFQPVPLSSHKQAREIEVEFLEQTGIVGSFRLAIEAIEMLHPDTDDTLEFPRRASGDASLVVGGVRIGLVAPRLLRLLSEVAGNDVRRLWADFLTDGRRELIEDWGSLCGFDFDRGLVTTSGPNVVAARQVLWLEELIRHTALAQTAAYLDSREMAFELSLFGANEVKLFDNNDFSLDVPRLYELGFLYARKEHDVQAQIIQDILARSNGVVGPASAASSREPSPFHLALADLVYESQSNRGLNGVILSSCWDLEMQRALARTLRPYFVILPIWIPRIAQQGGEAALRAGTTRNDQTGVDEQAEGQAGADEQAVEDLPPVPAWICGRFIGDEDGAPALDLDFGWKAVHAAEVLDRINEQPWQADPSAPILVCLAGAPLMKLHEFGQLRSEQQDILRAAGYRDGRQPMVHRLIMDETDLLGRIKGPLPEEVSKLLDARHIFFFGYPSSSVSSRVHMYAISGADASLREVKSETRFFSMDRPTVLGRAVLENWEFGSASCDLEDVIDMVVAETPSLMRGGGR